MKVIIGIIYCKRGKFIIPYKYEANRGKFYLAFHLRHPNGKQKFHNFHRERAKVFIKNTNPDEYNIVDHINSDSLDNRLENLRWTDATGNCRNVRKQKNNTSGYIGVSWNKARKKWKSQIVLNNKKKYLGYFLCKIEAAKAYDKIAKENGFENLNFLD